MKLAIVKELLWEWENIIKWKIVFGQKEIFLRKVRLALATNPEIAKNEELANKINSIQTGIISSKQLWLSSPEEINKSSLEVWLRKKMLERIISWKSFHPQEALEKLKKERWFDHISNDELNSKIISGEIILEFKPIRIEENSLETNQTDKMLKKIEIIKNKVKTIRSIILTDIKNNYHFTIENLGDITPIIESVQKSLKSMNKESERLNDEFITLKNELVKWLNSDEWTIKSSLFQIHQIINSL